MPGATIVATPQGEIAPVWKSAPFLKLLVWRLGPGGITVIAKVCVKLPPADAVTVTAPGVEPAVRVTCARPLEPVVTLFAEIVAGPLTVKLTGKFATGCPFEPFTWTTSGWGAACPEGT